MEIIHVSDKRFAKYGQIVEGIDLTGMIELLKEHTPLPTQGTVYVASDPVLEAHPAAEALKNRGFGGMDVQIGYCNGEGSKLTCLEYHRSSEIDIAAHDMILLLACQSDLENYSMTTDQVKAFFVPEGTAVELYATTLHYAPSSPAKGVGFRMGCVLPRGTNTEKPEGVSPEGEGRLLTANNKWLIASAGTDEAAGGAFIGIHGPAVDLFP